MANRLFDYKDFEYYQDHSGLNKTGKAWTSFHDDPYRYPENVKSNQTYWNGQLSLVGLDGSGIYHSMITFKYGFTISKSGVLTIMPPIVTKPNNFQDSLINSVQPRQLVGLC